MMDPDDLRHQLAAIVAGAATLGDACEAARVTPSTLNEHWDTLVRYGREARTVLEFGGGFSTLAWLQAGAAVVSVDTEEFPWSARLVELAGGRLQVIVGSDLELTPRPADLLYVDTLHVYAQLQAELNRHGTCAPTVILHDTETFRTVDSALTKIYNPGDPGLWPAVEEFCQRTGYAVVEHFTHQHGLTVLKR